MPAVAILGASTHRAKFGNKAVRAFQLAGWRVHPVNPRQTPIEGLATLASLADLPERVDVLSVYLPASVTCTLTDDIAAARPGAVWLNPGAESPELLFELSRKSLPYVLQCSIMALGFSPSQFPD